MTLSNLPYAEWRRCKPYTGGYGDPITEKQKEFILELTKTKRRLFELKDLEDVVGCALDDMCKGDAAFLIGCLKGDIEEFPICACGEVATVKVRLSFYDGTGRKAQELWACQACMDQVIHKFVVKPE
jgi:hypothetical protein